MTSRERVAAALSFEPPDRVPIDLNMSVYSYCDLLRYLGKRTDRMPYPNAAMEVVPDPEVLTELGVDIISVKAGMDKRLGKDGPNELPSVITDRWGIERRIVEQRNGAFYEVVSHPLSGATLRDIETYPWPDCDPGEIDSSLEAGARELYLGTGLALMGRFGGPILETAADLVGMEEWYVRLMTDPAFASKLLDRIGLIATSYDLQGLASCGQYLQILKVSGEDLGMQTAPLFPPDVFRATILPPLAARWSKAKERARQIRPDIKIMLHSCGAIRDYIPDLIRAGIDILDPVQPTASGMQPSGLKAQFGTSVVFHGGVDVQRLLPFGSEADVKEATIGCLDGFQAGRGGFIAAPSHAVQADVPPQNVLAMIEAVSSNG